MKTSIEGQSFLPVISHDFQTDVLTAVGLYAKFPFTEALSFDDGYLHGEIVRHLMKKAQYDDLRLKGSLIAFVIAHCMLACEIRWCAVRMGRIMGLPAVEGYVKVLDEKFKYSKMLKEVCWTQFCSAR